MEATESSQIPVRTQAIINPGRDVVSAARMPELIARVIEEQLYTEIPLEELMAVDERPSERPGRRPTKHARYELRHLKTRLSESAYNGKVSVNMFVEDLRYRIRHVHEGLVKSQPNADWRLVGASVEQASAHALQTVGVASPVYSDARYEELWADERAAQHGYSRPQRTSSSHVLREYEDRRWHIELVFADVTQGELIDPQVIRGDDPTRVSWYAAYIDSDRDIAKLSHNAKLKRKAAERVIREMLGLATARVERAIPPAPRLTREQLDLANQMLVDGVAPAMLATLLGVPLEVLGQVLSHEARPAAAPRAIDSTMGPPPRKRKADG